MFEISVSHEQGNVPVTVMHLKGDFDSNSSNLFDKHAREVVEAGAMDVLVDMSDVRFMSSSGIRSLHSLFYLLHPQGSEEHKRILNEGVRIGSYKAPHMKLINPSKQIKGTLEMAGIDMYMAVLNGDEVEAVNSF